jgi:hypothetical protein
MFYVTFSGFETNEKIILVKIYISHVMILNESVQENRKNLIRSM